MILVVPSGLENKFRGLQSVVDLNSSKDRTDQIDNNRLEILTFTLEGNEGEQQTQYGINVFKVRELITLPRLTRKPNSHECAPGMANVRGVAVPVIDLQKYYECSKASKQNILILTEFCGSAQGFIVEAVGEIIQLDWQNIAPPPTLVSGLNGVNHGNTLTGISTLPDGSLTMIVDLEKIITEVLGSGIDIVAQTQLTKNTDDLMIFFVDDSLVARTQISNILDKMGIRYQCAKDGQEALEMLTELAKASESVGARLADSISTIITDVEMPKMNGYTLTRRIKEDRRFDGIPVMMHSSLSAEQCIKEGKEAGVDAYLTKLAPKEFAEKLNQLIDKSHKNAA